MASTLGVKGEIPQVEKRLNGLSVMRLASSPCSREPRARVLFTDCGIQDGLTRERKRFVGRLSSGMRSTARCHGAQAVVTVGFELKSRAMACASVWCTATALGLLAAGCADTAASVAPAERVVLDVRVCDLAPDGQRYAGRRLRVRAVFGTSADHVRLSDGSCPSTTVFLTTSSDAVDLTLCRSDDLAARYGCPISVDAGVRATFVGIFRPSCNGLGIIDVESMSDVSRQR